MNRNRIISFVIGIVVLGLMASSAINVCRPRRRPHGRQHRTAKSKEDVVSAEGNSLPKSASDLAFRTGGRVIEVLVSEGAVVKQGQPLVHLQDDELKIAAGSGAPRRDRGSGGCAACGASLARCNCRVGERRHRR